ncbi:hypothetical protein EH244_30225 [Variovorax beijingensis]|uniref:DUF2946 domain-containing protein n=2 Tax=Variovorax beijingensis TaxID=2496117 RepID=A0A3P3E2K6_9BURK|nr:hypothetical protein EH244_30225 [Variovorax beijingensis]RSZ29190.1 hypothetical protein EJO66_30565 [Variovorax beijingensis]
MLRMHRVRLFVLWIVMFAVPFQAYAAAAMVFCGPGHDGAALAAAATAAPAGAHRHAQEAHGDGHADHHHHEAAAQDAGPSADGQGAGTTAHADPDGMHKCGTCGACHATALTGTLELIVFQGLPRADLVEPASTVATVAPRLLDKPPRA